MSIHRVLGIDPGSRKAGWGIVDVCTKTRKTVHVDNGVLMLNVKEDVPARLVELSKRLQEVCTQYSPSCAAVEDVFLHKGARSALVLGQARGAAIGALGLMGLPIASHTTTQVKARVTGTGRASKEQVAEMVMRLCKLKAHPFEDAADALAVALCHGVEILAQQTVGPSIPKAKKSKTKRKGFEELARAQNKI